MKAVRATAVIITLLTPALMQATGQIPDELIVNGKVYHLNTNPLEPFLAANPQRRPKARGMSTALWRGYIATWRVEDDQLVLTDIRVPQPPTKDPTGRVPPPSYCSAFEEVFPNTTEVRADWYSGHLIVPTGDLVSYVHMGYASTYSKYLVVTVEAGHVASTREMDRAAFETFRALQFSAFRKTTDYSRIRAETAKNEPDWPEEEVANFLFEYCSERYLSTIFPKGSR